MAKPTCTPEPASGLLADLNAAQRQAVTTPPGPLRVVAGAGTGKTRVLTRRVAWLVHQGAHPAGVLAITFTNKAARVLRDRLGQLPGGDQVWAGTFHGFGAWLLRRHGDAIGVDPRFTILDRDDQHRLLKLILDEVAPGEGRLRVPAVSAQLGWMKNGGGGREPLALDRAGLRHVFDAIAERYAERLRAARLLDFDDLLLESVRVLVEGDGVGDLLRDRFRHVLVDEYQDTNRVQRDLLLQLVPPGGSLTVVGDPDQSIYRWRGATIENILAFDEDLGGATTVVLEQNYRSTQRILACAEAVIARNTNRHAKQLVTENPQGPAVEVHRAGDAEEEGRLVAARIVRWIAAGRRPDAVAVIYRVNAASRAIELALRERRVPYKVVAGTEFFQRREVKDLLAYARLVENPDDDVSFLRIANVPRRGVGGTSLDRVRALAFDEGVSIASAARRAAAAGVKGRALKGLSAVLRLLDDVRTRPRRPVHTLLAALAEGSGYRAMLETSEDELERSRIENVDELLAFARQLDERERDLDLAAFLERAALVSEQDDVEEEGGHVQLMSTHAAKGLEFPCVLVAGVEDGWFPHVRSVDDEGGTEEERRLFYVAMTRAEEELVLTFSSSRATYRGFERRLPSPFLEDLPADSVEVIDRAPSWSGPWRPGGRDARGGFAVEESPPSFPVEGEVVREVGEGFHVGHRVHHPYFGEGTLSDMGGRGEDVRVTVDFDGHGRRQLLLRHARLTKVTR
jgi:DNA helicase-2/ATP-dependent DNA helicase PcrA